MHCLSRSAYTCEIRERRARFAGGFACGDSNKGPGNDGVVDESNDGQEQGPDQEGPTVYKKAAIVRRILEVQSKLKPKNVIDVVFRREFTRDDPDFVRWITCNYKLLSMWCDSIQSGVQARWVHLSIDELWPEPDPITYMTMEDSVKVLRFLVYSWDNDQFVCAQKFLECIRIFNRENQPQDKNTVFCEGYAGTGKSSFVRPFAALARNTGDIGQCDVQNTQFVFCNLPNRRLILGEELHCGTNETTINMLKRILGGETVDTPLKGKNETGTIKKTPVFATGNGWILRPEMDHIHGPALRRRILHLFFPTSNREILSIGNESIPPIYREIDPCAIRVLIDEFNKL